MIYNKLIDIKIFLRFKIYENIFFKIVYIKY